MDLPDYLAQACHTLMRFQEPETGWWFKQLKSICIVFWERFLKAFA